MMRVALDLQAAIARHSGIPEYTYELARRLRDVEDMSFVGNLFNFQNRWDVPHLTDGLPFPVRRNTMMRYGVYRRLWRLLPLPYAHMFPADADVTHFLNYIAAPGVRGKIVISVYDMTYRRFPETMDARNRRFLTHEMKRSIDIADRVVTISKHAKSELVELLGVEPGRIDIVPPAAALPVAPPFVPPQRLDIQGPYLLYLGTLEPRKNLLRLMEAYRLLKKETGTDVQLVLAGGIGWKADEIVKAAQETPGVCLAGRVSDAEKLALYHGARAFVFPSLYEGFGMPVLEALQCGVPVVCSRAEALVELAGDCAELVQAQDAPDIARGLYNVLTKPDETARQVARGLVRARDFSWDASARALCSVYRRTLQG